jgi:hypothetical protein
LFVATFATTTAFIVLLQLRSARRVQLTNMMLNAAALLLLSIEWGNGNAHARC